MKKLITSLNIFDLYWPIYISDGTTTTQIDAATFDEMSNKLLEYCYRDDEITTIAVCGPEGYTSKLVDEIYTKNTLHYKNNKNIEIEVY